MHGLVGRHRGFDRQNLFLLAMENIPDYMRPFWLKSFREASTQEDHDGFDAFVELDIGVVPIQIKSSTRGAENYLRHHSRVSVLIVVIHEGVDETDIRVATINALRTWRAEVLYPMRRWRMAWMPLFNFSPQPRSA